MKFRKKPVVICAIQYFKDRWVASAPPEFFEAVITDDKQLIFPHIKALEGNLHITEGDWIIRGIKGEFYPCKPDIFAATYELAEPTVPFSSPVLE